MTFQKELESETPVYGVLKPARTWNPIHINFMHLIQLFKDAIRARKWKDKLRIWFMPTGWRPKDVEKLYPLDIITNPHEYKKYQTKKDSFLNIWSCFQLTIHLAMQFHIIYLINFIESEDFNVAVLLNGYQMLVLYGIFFMFSIGSFTSLMDRSQFSLILEIIKNSIGFFIIFYFQEVLNVFQGIYLPKSVVILYLIISQAITIFFFFKFQKRKIMPISL